MQGSVGDPGGCRNCGCVEAIAQLGRCDIVVNNAAINPVFGPLMDADLRRGRESVRREHRRPAALRPRRVARVDARARRVVLNVVSVGGMRPGPFIGAYNVSKAALIHLTRQLAQELAPGVRVNAIAPALVKTDMARALWEPNEEAMARSHALGRLGVPDDIASGALFLVSDARHG